MLTNESLGSPAAVYAEVAHEPLKEHSQRGVDRRRQYRAIFVLGPSSSGKTTLCDALAKELDIRPPRYIKEVARNLIKTSGFTRNDTGTYEMQHAIMMAQLAAEERAAASAAERSDGLPLFLSDRSAIDPIVYAETSGLPEAFDRRNRLIGNPALQSALTAYRASLFVVLEPVAEWLEDDGVRSLEDPWRYNEVLFAALRGLRIPYVVIGDETRDLHQRVAYVIKHFASPFIAT